MLVGRDLRPGRSVTPESQSPAVVMGLYADWVLRERSGSERGGESNGVGRVGESLEGRVMIGDGIVITVGRVLGSSVGVSEEDRSRVEGRASSFMRSNSTLRFVCLSSSLSGSAWSSKASPYRLLMLPLILKTLVLPVELARRDRVFWTGEAFGVVFVESGEGKASVKLVLRGSLSMPVLRSFGKERRFSSTVETGEAERGDSRNDMDTVRLLAGRKVAEVSREGVGG